MLFYGKLNKNRQKLVPFYESRVHTATLNEKCMKNGKSEIENFVHCCFSFLTPGIHFAKEIRNWRLIYVCKQNIMFWVHSVFAFGKNVGKSEWKCVCVYWYYTTTKTIKLGENSLSLFPFLCVLCVYVVMMFAMSIPKRLRLRGMAICILV